jgi:signal transduction histidine kinase
MRLAMSVATVAFVILVVFAVVVGQINAHRQRSDFDSQVTAQAQNIAASLHPVYRQDGTIIFEGSYTALANINNAALRIFTEDGRLYQETPGAPNLGSPFRSTTQVGGYRVATVRQDFGPGGENSILVQYGAPVASLNREIESLRLILFLGALIGTALAFGAGYLVARRAIAPVAQLTAVAAEIERTGDPNRKLPEPVADDEIAELSRTLTGMLTSLSEARDETEATLERQRAFVADASHELRTPLTSVLANLELLVDSVKGADHDAAQSALRSTQRMRRLVGDLLLLARTDAGQTPVREPLDLAAIVIDAASELGSVSSEHVVDLDVRPTPMVGNRDDLQRVVTNLLENALRHTPPNTRVTASTRSLPDGSAELAVADDGPGIPPELRPKLFSRFIRGSGDRGGSFGLGLAIVAAVAQAHGGTVETDASPHGGARFTVRLPAAADAWPTDDAAPPDAVPAVPVEPVSPTPTA